VLAALLVAAAALPAGAACRPGDVSIVSATPDGARSDGSLDDVRVTVVVRNEGGSVQSGNTLQSVDIYQAGSRVGAKGIPPLRPGQSYAFTYTFQRSPEAAPGTTQLLFRLVGDNPAGAACVNAAQRIRLNV
jgi:hypothetical protein